jgi:beta-phosphoglucomutase-like phosphatase (HAD superfamily)
VHFAQSFADTYVVSNGEHQNVLASLKFSNLAHFFSEDKVISGRMSANPKPAPDLFIMAAQKAGVSANRTLVIEDSITGIKGAMAANMSVWGYCGTHHDPQDHAERVLTLGTQKAFLNMEDLLKTLKS